MTDTPPWMMDAGEFCAYMQELKVTFHGQANWIGIALRHLLLHSPLEVTRSCARQWNLFSTCSPTTSEPGHNDVFPLPLRLSEEDLRWDDAAKSPAMLAAAGRASVHRAWLHCMVLVLNSWAAAPQSTNRRACDQTFPDTLRHADFNVAQATALAHLSEMAMHFLEAWDQGVVKARDWDELLTRRLDSYAGMVTTRAHDVTCEQVIASLPPEGLAGRVNAVELTEGTLREILLDPERLVLPRSQWPRRFRRAKIRAPAAEWPKLAAELVRRGILRVLEPHEAVHDSEGNRLGAGLFGVPKGQTINLSDGTLAEVLRLIVNLVPANEVMEVLPGDIHTLPYVGQWASINLDDDMVLWSAEDLRCGFYLFGLPHSWAKWFALDLPVPGWAVNRPDLPEAYLGVIVVPMGWSSGTGLVQHLFRRIALRESALPPQLELRKDQPLPCYPDFLVREWWQIYIDNYDEARCYQKSEDMLRDQNELSCWALCLRENGEPLGVLFTNESDKNKRQATATKTLGAEASSLGRARPTVQRMTDFMGLAFATLSTPRPRLKHLEITGGVGVSLVPFRRQLMGCYGRLWQVLGGEESDDGPNRSCLAGNDFVQAMALLPLCAIKLNRPVDEVATASDASEWAGAVTASTGLTPEGHQRLHTAEMRRATGPCDGLTVVDWFSGIGGLRRALEVLGVQPCTYLTSEIDENAARVVRHQYPECIELGDITQVSKDSLEEAMKHRPHTTHLLSFGGSPCQDASGANFLRLGLAGSRSSLWETMEKLEVDVLPQVFPVARFARGMENVASMSLQDVAKVSEVRGHFPYKVCASEFVPARRPRLFWLSWEIPASGPLAIVPHQFWNRVRWDRWRATAYNFLPPRGRVGAGFTAFPTFMRPTPRRQPPSHPNGLKYCTDSAVQAWQEDSYRYAPYQYMPQNLVSLDSGKSWILPPIELKEKLYNYRPDHTMVAIARRNRQKVTASEAKDVRHGLIGNSLDVNSMVSLLLPLLQSWGFTSPHAQLVDFLPQSSQDAKPDAAKLLVRAYASYSAHRGGELRLEAGPVAVQGRPPFQGINAEQWSWQTVVQASWKLPGEHINSLEARAYVLALKWRSRSSQRHGSTFLHLTDSQVCLGSFLRHRSPAYTQNFLCLRAAALELAADFHPVLGWVRSHRNPADKPSRSRWLNLNPRQSKNDRDGGAMA